MLQPGDTFAGYEIRGVLGVGGMGAVFRASQKNLEREVALKVMQDSGSVEARDAARRFVRETRIHIALTHPHLVRVLDAGVFEGQRYLVMEIVEGKALDVFLAQYAGDRTGFGMRSAQALASAVDYLHRNKIVHRDLKPGNILLDHEDVPKITDFGIARKIGGTLVTFDTGIIGTLPYMAPEVILEQPVEEPADVYALGLIMYEIFTGRMAQDGESMEAIVRKIRSETPRAPSAYAPSLPRALDALILACLEKQPSARPTAAAVQQRLEAILEQRELSSPELSIPERPTRAHVPKRRDQTMPVRKEPVAARTGETPREVTGTDPIVSPPRPRRAWVAVAALLPAVFLSMYLALRDREVPVEPVTPSRSAGPAPRIGLLDRLLVREGKRLHVRLRTRESVRLTLELTSPRSERKLATEETARRWHSFDVDPGPIEVTEVTYRVEGGREGARTVPEKEAVPPATSEAVDCSSELRELSSIFPDPECLWTRSGTRTLAAALAITERPLDPGVIEWSGLVGEESLGAALARWLRPPAGWPDADQVRLQFAYVPRVARALCRSRSRQAPQALEAFLLGGYSEWMTAYPGELDPAGVRLYMQHAFRHFARYRPEAVGPLLEQLTSKDPLTAAHMRAALCQTSPDSLLADLRTDDNELHMEILRGLPESALPASYLPALQQFAVRTDRTWDERLRTASLAAAHPAPAAGKILEYLVGMAGQVETDTHQILSMCVRFLGLQGDALPLEIATSQLQSPAWMTRRAALRSLIFALFHARRAKADNFRVDPAVLQAMAPRFESASTEDDAHADKVLFLALTGSPRARDAAGALLTKGSDYEKWIASLALLQLGDTPAAPPAGDDAHRRTWKQWTMFFAEPERPDVQLYLVDPSLPFLPTGLMLEAGDRIRVSAAGIGAPHDPPEGGGEHAWTIEDAESSRSTEVHPEGLWLEALVAEEILVGADDRVGSEALLVPLEGELFLRGGPRSDWIPGEDWIFHYRRLMKHAGWMVVRVQRIRPDREDEDAGPGKL